MSPGKTTGIKMFRETHRQQKARNAYDISGRCLVKHKKGKSF
jgi:hypothetical protein